MHFTQQTQHRFGWLVTSKNTAPSGTVFSQTWRWGESNPRPATNPEDFSGCSLLTISQPSTTCRPAVEWAQSAKCRCHAADTRNTQWLFRRRQEPEEEQPSGLTDSKVQAAIRQRGRSQCDFVWHLFVLHTLLRVSMHSRPASPRSRATVETDHPLLNC